jgi:hypothetical protein
MFAAAGMNPLKKGKSCIACTCLRIGNTPLAVMLWPWKSLKNQVKMI